MSIKTSTLTAKVRDFTNSLESTLRENWFAYLLVIPTILYLGLLIWYPGARGFYMSFFDWPLFGQKEFVGINNYTNLLLGETQRFYNSVVTTVLYMSATALQMGFGILMALIVWKQKRFSGLIAIIFILPFVIPPIVTATIWRQFFHPTTGPFFKMLVEVGVLSQPIYWRTDGTLALISMTGAAVYTWSSFVFLLVLASLQGISDDILESAEVFGASSWQRFRYVILPNIKTGLYIALILRIIRNIDKVEQPLQITGGGPGWETSILGVYLYRLAWQQYDMGVAYAAGMILAVFALTAIVFFLWRFQVSSQEVQEAI